MDYSIANTTKEERLAIVKNALGISISGTTMPSEESLKIVKQYVDGKKELEDVQKEIIEMYKENESDEDEK
jgi:hypothetical protein